jgi:predicted O-linked N-acetylglucosamine transferase (SPINDLY family)
MHPIATTTTAAPASEVEGEIALSRSGQMQLGDLIQRAQALSDRGLADASAQLYEAWIASTDSPYRHVACFNWGTVLGNLHRHAEAEKAYRHALALHADFPQARLNLGHQIEHQHRPDEALAEWQAVLDMTAQAGPAALEFRLHALNNSARLLELLRRLDPAEALMRQSLELKADQPDVLQHYVHIRQKQCKWPLYEAVGEVTQNQLLLGTSALATLSASDDPVLQLLSAQRFVHARTQKISTPPLHEVFAARTPRSGKVKIGYLSGDLCMHAVGLLTPELFELHDRSRFEVYGFCWSREDGTAQRQRILAGMDQVFRIGGLDDQSAARLIAQMGVDVLVDLQGLTNGARPTILAHRPAPIQAGYLGLPATSALPGVDWLIADRFVMPEAELRYYTEKPLYLPNCYQVSDRKRDVAPKPTRAQYGLPEDAFVFCSFNNNHKFTEDVFKSWMRILAQVPKSVLWLLADNEWAQANMQRVAAEHGIAAERLIFAPRVAPPEYLARFQLADLFLDTFPYNAGTTASDALWMGTPIVTLSGRSYISRMAGSLLTNVGLPDLVTHTLEAYEQLAVQIGRNPLRAQSYKRYLAEHGRQSALFDIPGLVRDLENEFERMALARRA